NINLDDKSDEGSREGKGADRNVTIKGEGRKAADGGAIIQHSSAGPANESGPAHIKGESVTEAEGQSGKEVLSTGKYTMAKRTKRSLKDLLPSGEKAADGGAIASTAAGGNGGGLTGFANDGSDGGKPAQNGGTSGGGNDGTRSAEDLANMLKRTLFGEGKEEPAEQTSPRSVMERVVADAMNDICVPTEKDEVLGRVNRVGVFPVDSNTTPGYLVIALPRSMAKGADEDFLRKVEAAVHRRFKDSGFPGRIETGFWAPIPKISFVDFSAEKSSFSLTVSHEGMQIGAAFFRADKSLPQVKEFDQEDMLSVEIEDISTELPVNFKAYLHLRANRKYFLYLRSGRRFQPEQKERLQNRNVTDFFMKRIDKENLRLFLAESFLRDLVRAFGRKAG
ncbi:MAG TPA: hypothetical protein PKC28_15345, partial [Bdellovibrionales bacterium]|nr:hypothetical protein [Bdellovibrionales bacterium]